MSKPPESGESLSYDYDPRLDWQRETQDILDDLRKEADIIIAQTKTQQPTPSVPPSNNKLLDLIIDEDIANIENAKNQVTNPALSPDDTPSVPTLWETIRRPLGLTCALVLPLVLIIWLYNNTLQTCENKGVLYKNQLICGDTPEKQDAMFEYIACDYIQTNSLDKSFVTTFDEFDKIKRDSIVPSLEAYLRRDKFSFRKNVAIAYFNSATQFINQKQMDSACWAFINSYQYFEKLDLNRTNDTLKKMAQMALQAATICEAPIQLNYPTATYAPQEDDIAPPNNQSGAKIKPSKKGPIKRAIKNRIESRIDNAPIPSEALEKLRYPKQSPH